MIKGETDETGNRCLITNYLRHIKESCLERGSTTGDKRRLGMHEERIGIVVNQFH